MEPRLYVSAARELLPELLKIRTEIQPYGIRVCSSWLDREDSAALSLEQLVEAALISWQDIHSADIFLAYQPPSAKPLPYSGLRACEFGVAMSLGVPIIVVGNREYSYQFLPQVRHLPIVSIASLADAVIGLYRSLIQLRPQNPSEN